LNSGNFYVPDKNGVFPDTYGRLMKVTEFSIAVNYRSIFIYKDSPVSYASSNNREAK
jgi:hypothetical protein